MELFQEIICLKKIKDGKHIINLDEYANVPTHWIGLYFKNDEIFYFNSFGVEHASQENLLSLKT